MAISRYTNPDYYFRFLRYSIESTVAFAGSGCSTVPGIPMWKGFVQKLQAEVNVNAPNVNTFIEEGKILEAASLIYDALPNPADFYDGIADLINNNRIAYYHDLHMAIWSSFYKVITTNYDDCLEHALNLQNTIIAGQGVTPPTISLQQIPTLSFEDFDNAERSIAYIHGRAGSQDLVLRKEDYQKYYPSRYPGESPDPSTNLENFLKSVVEKYAFVFIGFSLNDEDFVKSFENYRAEFKERNKDNPEELYRFSNRYHFIFLLNDELKDWVNMDDLKNAGLSLDKITHSNILVNYGGVDSERKVFRRNFQGSFEQYDFTAEERAKTITLSERILFNQQKLKRLSDLNILDIRLPGKDFKSISSFLTGIKRTDASSDQIGLNDI